MSISILGIILVYQQVYDDAAAAFAQHLSRIDDLIASIKAENHSWFTDDAE